MRIRPARPDDAEALTELSMLSKQSNGYDDEFMALCAEELRITSTQIKRSRFWVAETDTVCGCASLQISSDGNTGTVGAFFVHPDWQRHGVGRRLWNKLLQHANDQALVSLRLDADPFAEKFYKKLGFQTVGQSPSGSIEGRTIPHMELSMRDVE